MRHPFVQVPVVRAVRRAMESVSLPVALSAAILAQDPRPAAFENADFQLRDLDPGSMTPGANTLVETVRNLPRTHSRAAK